MCKFDLTTIGEGQVRLTSQRGERMSSARHIRMNAACSEANVSGLLAQLGRACSWATVLPTGNVLTKRVLWEYRSVGVDLSNVVKTPGGRVALYFMEPGEYPMPSRVTYDREHTPFRDMTIDMFNWDSLLDTRLVFVTGITASLTEKTARVVRYFVDQAYERGIDVALDVNYRSMLWEPEDAHRVLGPIARKSRVVFCSRRDAKIVFGVTAEGPEACHKLREEFEIPYVVSTDQIAGVYLAGPEGVRSFEVRPVSVVDRPGAGDSFVAGTLHGYLEGDIEKGVHYGQRASAHSLTHHGDLVNISPTELDIPTTTDIVR